MKRPFAVHLDISDIDLALKLYQTVLQHLVLQAQKRMDIARQPERNAQRVFVTLPILPTG
jgi:hypothetical protein